MPVETNNENVNNNGTSVVDGAQQKIEEQQQKAEEPKQQGTPKTTSKKAGTKKRKSVKGKSRRKSTTKKPVDPNRRTRLVRSFPASTFEEALPLAEAIQQFARGQKIRRLTLFDNLKKSPDSSYSRQLVTNSTKYGLTAGSYNAEYLELTQDGKIVTNSEIDEQLRLKTKFKLAIEKIQPFNELYENLKGNKLPVQAVLHDFLLEKGYKPEEVNECVDTFIVNAKYLTLLRPISGSERLLPLEHVLEELPRACYELLNRIW